MIDNAGPNHVQIDVYQPPQQMLSGFDGGCMVKKRLSVFFAGYIPVPFFRPSIQSRAE
jgi:hypothetical protein